MVAVEGQRKYVWWHGLEDWQREELREHVAGEPWPEWLQSSLRDYEGISPGDYISSEDYEPPNDIVWLIRRGPAQ